MDQDPEKTLVCTSCGTSVPDQRTSNNDSCSDGDNEQSDFICVECQIAEHRKARHESAIKSLPPKFVTSGVTSGNSLSSNEILLPNADGGTDTLDQRTVRIEHKGEIVELAVLTPEQRRRRRIIYNGIAFVMAAVMLWVAYKILTF